VADRPILRGQPRAAAAGIRVWSPVARSPIPPAPPLVLLAGWEVSGRRSAAPLRLVDCTPLAKVLVRADPAGPLARGLGVPFGRARRDELGTLVVGSGPDEWLLLAAPGAEAAVAGRVRDLAGQGEHVSVVELLTHGRALLRLTGVDAARALAKVCAVNLADRVTPDGAAFRSAVADLATDVIRDDRDGTRGYLLHCERSSGRYLFEVLLDAGREFGIDTDGFTGREL
jgi:heterotetrameric sarcosine oxidase gamma subunit